MPEMNEIGRNVSCAIGIAWSADFASVATARPSGRQAGRAEHERDERRGQRVEVDVHAERRDRDGEQQARRRAMPVSAAPVSHAPR